LGAALLASAGAENGFASSAVSMAAPLAKGLGTLAASESEASGGVALTGVAAAENGFGVIEATFSGVAALDGVAGGKAASASTTLSPENGFGVFEATTSGVAALDGVAGGEAASASTALSPENGFGVIEATTSGVAALDGVAGGEAASASTPLSPQKGCSDGSVADVVALKGLFADGALLWPGLAGLPTDGSGGD
jgi:hypothetical protein